MTAPELPWVRVVVIGPADLADTAAGRWHVYALLHPDDEADPLAKAKQVKLGTVTPEHAGDLEAHVRPLIRRLVSVDYGLSRAEHWDSQPYTAEQLAVSFDGASDRIEPT